MTAPTGRSRALERLKEANLAAGLAVSRGSRRVASAFLPTRLRLPTRLLIAPQDLRSREPTLIEDVLSGHLTFAGRRIAANGLSPFDVAAPTEAFATELHGFSWLRHASAAGQDLSPALRVLIGNWIERHQRLALPAYRPDVLARRLISWISQSPVLLAGADEAFYRLFIRSLHRQASILLKERRVGLPPAANLTSLLALACYALSTDRNETFATAIVDDLLVALRREILPDGGHIGRNPQRLIDVLHDLLPLQQAFSARGLRLPAEMPATIARMIDLLRLLRHDDGTLGLFNGMGPTEASDVAALLAYGVRHRPLIDASYSGYQRLQGGRSVAIVDAGRRPPSRYSLEAHAGCLALEFSSEGWRIIVNCGRPPAGDALGATFARETAAHSTLIVGDRSSGQFSSRVSGPLAGRMIRGPQEVSYGREANEAGDTLVARHDGYRKALGVVHQRSVWLATDGAELEGQDQLLLDDRPTGAKPIGYALRFHLHPAIRVEAVAATGTLILTAPNGVRWTFDAPGHRPMVAESIFFASRQGRQRTQQIVIEGETATSLTLDWMLRRIG